MSNVQIDIKKDHWGKWVAISNIKVQGDRWLKISSYKNDRGLLVSNASVYELEIDGGFRVEKFAMFQDYSKRVREVPVKVANQKAVLAQQQAVINEQPEQIMADVKAQYGIA